MAHQETRISSYQEAQRIVQELESSLHTPHQYLGIHRLNDNTSVIRLYRPGAETMHMELYGYIVEMKRVHEAGLFEMPVPPECTCHEYRIFHTSGLLAHDPYAFWPTLGEVDAYLFNKGVHYQLHRTFGGRLKVHQGVSGAAFTVWAPSAKQVSLVGDFNHWNGLHNPMRSLGASGVWEIFVPGLTEGMLYKFEICTQEGKRLIKSDPYGLAFEKRPKTGSCLADPYTHVWLDQAWMEQRKKDSLHKPLSIYEVHLGSWKKSSDGGFLSYKELAHELSSYVKEMGFTHIELMPVAEHPLDESWGYQVTGYLAPTSRFGTFSDFQYFVDVMHQNGIGVLLDWVPGHFPTDDFALHRFDGTALYEHEDPKLGFHPHWNTAIFNFGRHEVSNFLLASAFLWLDLCHIDGLRVDAVASMIYLDYGREEGQWIPNEWGGKENTKAIEFLRHANSIIHSNYPGALMIAEESTAFPRITHGLNEGGIGFDLKWNMGWMNDTLRYISKDPIYRKHHQNDLTFNLIYAFSERFMLVLSHDEVVHGKASLLSKMPGDMWQKFANLRLLFSYMMSMPGKKLLFQGGEIAQWNEWYSQQELEWFLLRFPYHSGIQRCVKELNHFYREHSPLWADDFSFEGFEWVDFSDADNSVIAYLRKVPRSPEAVLVVHNFTPSYFEHYELPARHVQGIEELFNTDDCRFGGSGKVRLPVRYHHSFEGRTHKIILSLPPLATVIYKVYWQ